MMFKRKHVENEQEIKDIIYESMNNVIRTVPKITYIIIECVTNHKDQIPEGEVLCVWCKGKVRELCTYTQNENENIKSLMKQVHFPFTERIRIKRGNKRLEQRLDLIMQLIYKE